MLPLCVGVTGNDVARIRATLARLPDVIETIVISPAETADAVIPAVLAYQRPHMWIVAPPRPPETADPAWWQAMAQLILNESQCAWTCILLAGEYLTEADWQVLTAALADADNQAIPAVNLWHEHDLEMVTRIINRAKQGGQIASIDPALAQLRSYTDEEIARYGDVPASA